MKRGYYKQEIIIRESWWNRKTKIKYVPVKILSTKYVGGTISCYKYLIKLPDNTKREVWESEIFLTK